MTPEPGWSPNADEMALMTQLFIDAVTGDEDRTRACWDELERRDMRLLTAAVMAAAHHVAVAHMRAGVSARRPATLTLDELAQEAFTAGEPDTVAGVNASRVIVAFANDDDATAMALTVAAGNAGEDELRGLLAALLGTAAHLERRHHHRHHS